MKEIFSVKISNSPKSDKKYVAVFFDKDGKKIKTTHFGQRGASDFTKHGDEARRKRYDDRHRARENWEAPMTAGSLSKYILWNRKTLKASIADYGKRFKIKVISSLE
jgi:hypothetical protein